MFNRETIKEDLFGKTRKIEATGDNTADKSLLRQAFKGGDSAAYSFCSGCGTLREVNALGARILSNEAGMEGNEVPESFEGQYFKTGCCEECDSKEQSVALEDIN